MKIKQTKKAGISLIVLIITIIVMIILAAAIILSLQSSGIIGKANKAKIESDAANKREAAGVALAEYELAKQLGNLPAGTTPIKYVQDALTAQGIDASNVAIDENNNIIVGSGALAINKNIPIGATITNYNSFLTEKSYSTDGSERTGTSYYEGEVIEYIGEPQTLTTDIDMTWKYIGIDEKGNMLIAADTPEVQVDTNLIEILGQGGYLYGVDTLNTTCKELYSSTKGTARSIKIEDINRILEYTGPKATYNYNDEWLTLNEVLTVGELSAKLGVQLSNLRTPDETNTWEKLSTYKVNFYEIYEDSQYINKEIGKELIYNQGHWIASLSVGLSFDGDNVWFGMRAAYPDWDPDIFDSVISDSSMYSSDGDIIGNTDAIRPVVELNPDINITYDSNANTCTLG